VRVVGVSAQLLDALSSSEDEDDSPGIGKAENPVKMFMTILAQA
jgi:hypothetical protein